MERQRFASIGELDEWLAARNLGGMWQGRGNRPPGVQAQHWRWADIEYGLASAAELVPMESVAMRTLHLRNPDLADGISQTLHFSVQCLMPGERTKAHRNLVGETRFVLQAPRGAHFVIDGEAFPMSAGDLITTPNWSYHDHYNGGDAPAIWLDGMDTRLVNALGKSLNERFPGGDQQPISKPEGFAAKTLGFVRARTGEAGSQPPPFRYPWADTAAALAALQETEQEPDPHDGYHLTYVNPMTGGPTLPTYACEIRLLPAGFTGQPRRQNCTTICHAFRGSGFATVDDARVEWAQGDIFTVPPWSWLQYGNSGHEDAILYSITDQPALAALGLYRREDA